MTGCSPEQEGRICISVAEGVQKAFTLPELNGQSIQSSLGALQGTNCHPKFPLLKNLSFQGGLQFAFTKKSQRKS
jgi:hypothetical protein